MALIKFSIIITTKNRRDDLAITLENISGLLKREDVECIVWDDGSDDGTFGFISEHYPLIRLFRNEVSKGLIYSRNRLFERANGAYVISIDDDLHFLSKDPLDVIEAYFESNARCAVVSFRIFWSKLPPISHHTAEVAKRVKGFAGGANAWRMSAWKTVRDYPEWFVFYGEENFAAYELIKEALEIHYLPQVLVHHRVDMTARKKDRDYILRQRRSLRADWYLYLLFLPLAKIPKMIGYTMYIQLKNKVLKGNLMALKVILLAGFDVIVALPKIATQSNRLTKEEYSEFNKIADIQLYWKPKE